MAATRSTASAFPLFQSASATTFPSITLGAQGDIVFFTCDSFSALTGLPTNSGTPQLSWTLACGAYYGSYGTSTYIATVTAALAGATVTFTTPSAISCNNMSVDDWSSGLGSATIWTLNNNNPTNPASSTVASFGACTTGASGVLLWFGTIWGSATPSGGTSPVNSAAFGYVFFAPGSLGVATSTAVIASTAYSPTATWSTASTNSANALTVSAALPGTTTPRRPTNPMSNSVSRAANWFKRESGLYLPERGFLLPEAA